MSRAHIAWAALLVIGCGNSTKDDGAPVAPAEVDSIEKVSDVGPVVATVTVAPKAPRIGDVLQLTLRVESDVGTDVQLPPFGEALGRFSVVKFKPQRARTETVDGKARTVEVQGYSLQAAASGRQRIPGLRIEYRPKGQDKALELLTEEIAITVESVIPATEIGDELSDPPLALDETPGLPPWLWPAAVVAVLLALLGALAVLRARREAGRERAKLRAYDRALSRLAALESRPLPQPDEADAFYVELSGIVRQYLEDRLQLRAPELTTEEFLQLAKSYRGLQEDAREHLSQFLADCDRVKFAAYAPATEESAASLGLAREILSEQEQFLRARESQAVDREAG